MSRKLVIVGGVAGGATAAARARRLDETAEIVVIERGPDVSFANCGLPYHIGGEIVNREALLVQTKQGLESRFALDIRTRQEVTRIDRDAQCVHVKNLETGEAYTESYDALLLSPGAAPLVPPIDGIDHPQIFTLRNMVDMDRIKAAVDAGAQTAVVVGGGFIGLEMAENLRQRGLDVALVELLPQVMPPLDAEVAEKLHQTLQAHDVQLYLGTAATAFSDRDGRVATQLKSGAELVADLVVLAVGVRPETQLAKDAGLELSERGALLVNEQMRTSDQQIYAVGDAVQVNDAVLGGPTMVPLAGPANRQARIAVDNIFGRSARFRGAQGTSAVRVFEATAGSTGASEKVLQRRGVDYRKVYVHRGQHVGYFPGAQQMMIKLLFAPDDGRVLGAQVVGGDGVDKRIDVLATAIQAGLTVYDLEEVELAYTPQYGAAKDPVNIAGFVAVNLLSGDEQFVYAEQLDEAGRSDWTILDVREQAEFDAGHVPGAVHIPLGQLRQRWQELPTDKPLATYCGVGQRSYYANRILRQRGLQPHNIAGGLTTFNLVHAQRPTPRPLDPSRVEVSTVKTQEQTSAAPGCCSGAAADETVAVAANGGRKELDLRGLQCPGPLASLAQTAQQEPTGTLVRAVASDIGFGTDVEAWCRRGGHELLGVQKDKGAIVADIRLGVAGGNGQSGGNGQPGADSAAGVAAVRQLQQHKTMVVFSGDLDRVMGSFVIANAAADMGDQVTMFFTFWGLNALRKADAPAVEKDFMSRMFGWMMPRGARRLKLSQMHMLGMGTAMMKGVMRRKQVDDLPTMIASAQRKGVRLVACSMSMDVMGLKQEELLDGVEIAGAAGYLASASESGVNLFI